MLLIDKQTIIQTISMPVEKYFVRYFAKYLIDMFTCLLERLKLLDRDL